MDWFSIFKWSLLSQIDKEAGTHGQIHQFYRKYAEIQLRRKSTPEVWTWKITGKFLAFLKMFNNIIKTVFQTKAEGLQMLIKEKNSVFNQMQPKLASIRENLLLFRSEMLDQKETIDNTRKTMHDQIGHASGEAATRLKDALDEFRALVDQDDKKRKLSIRVVQLFRNHLNQQETNGEFSTSEISSLILCLWSSIEKTRLNIFRVSNQLYC